MSDYSRFYKSFMIIAMAIAILMEISNTYNGYVANRRFDHGSSLMDQGNKLMEAGDRASLQKAVSAFTEAASVFEYQGKEKENIGICQYDLGLTYWKLADDPKALYQFGYAINILEDFEDEKGLVKNCHEDIGKIHFDHAMAQGKDRKFLDAVHEYTQAVNAYGAAGDTENVALANNNLGAMAFNQGLAYTKADDWKRAIDMFQQAQTASHAGGNKSDEADALHFLSLDYAAIGQDAKAAEARQQEQTLRKSGKS